jgi:hypothetical protein
VRNWFWLAVVNGDKLRWPRWLARFLVVVFLGLLAAGTIYTFVVLRAVSERNNTHHVSPQRSH